MRRGDRRDDRGSTLPLILGFFLVALLTVAGSIALGEAFVQQRDLQDTCDGAATAAAASAGDLDRAGGGVGGGGSLRFGDVQPVVQAYLARSAGGTGAGGVRVTARLDATGTRIRLDCEQTRSLAFAGLLGLGTVRHTAVSTARAPVVG